MVFNTLFMEKISLVYSSVPYLYRIKSSWVKHLWFYSDHKNHEDISPQKFPAIMVDIKLDNNYYCSFLTLLFQTVCKLVMALAASYL